MQKYTINNLKINGHDSGMERIVQGDLEGSYFYMRVKEASA